MVSKVCGTVLRLVLLAVVLTAAGGMLWWWHQFRTGKPRVHTVSQGELLSGVTVSGTVRNQQKTSVTAEIVAAVRRVVVTEGKIVEEGELLIELDDRVVAAEHAKGLARVELAQQYLVELKAGPRKEEIAQAREAVNAADSELEYAKSNHRKVQQLADRGVAAPGELSLADKGLKVARAKLKAAQAGLELLLAGTRAEQIARAEAEVRLAQAEVQRCQALRGKYRLCAPHRGIVTARYVHVGEVVSPGRVLLHLNNVDQTEIRAQVQETQLAGIQPGHEARVLADAYPDHPLVARVERILPRVDPESGTVTVLLRLQGPSGVVLMDGMAVDIALIRERRGGVVRVPVEAVRRDGDRAQVWLRNGRQFVPKRIRIGADDGQWVEVRSGLSVGDVVRVN